jgi:hypothetical protein
VPMASQMTWGWPTRTSGPYVKMARPSDCQVSSKQPGIPAMPLTRRPRRHLALLRSCTNRAMTRLKAERCSLDSLPTPAGTSRLIHTSASAPLQRGEEVVATLETLSATCCEVFEEAAPATL